MKSRFYYLLFAIDFSTVLILLNFDYLHAEF